MEPHERGSEAGDGAAARRGRRLVLAAALLVWLSLALPLALGWETLYFRDVFNHHLPAKSFGVPQLAAGRIPAINPTCGVGQPYRGDPGMLAFYPGNVLYLALPFWSAFNLHYLLHWLLAFGTFWALARRLGLGSAGSALAALTWAGSGWALSTLTFYNLVVVAAWWPLVLLGGVLGGRRGIALGGLACGLALLGGEPLTAALGLAPLLALTVPRQGWRRGVATAVGIGGLGLLIALPQLVASLRVLGYSLRGTVGVHAGAHFALRPARLLELLVALPFGLPQGLGADQFWGAPVLGRPPFVLSLHFGVVALVLTLVGARRRPAWTALPLAGLALAWLGGLAPGALSGVTAGLFRFPEKFLFWFALGVPLLAGLGLQAVTSISAGEGDAGKRGKVERAPTPGWAVAAGLAVLMSALAVLAVQTGPRLVAMLAPWLSPEGVAIISASQVPRWFAASLLAAALLAATVWALRRRHAVALLLLQLLALLPLIQLVPTDSTAFYRQPPRFARELAAGTPVVSATRTSAIPRPKPSYRLPRGATRALWRHIDHLDLAYPTAIRAGLRQPLCPDAVGLHTPTMHLLTGALREIEESRLLPWLRALGVEAVVRVDRPRRAGWRRLAEEERFGVPTHLYTLEDPAPEVWWPEAVVPVAGPEEAFWTVADGADPLRRVVVPRELEPPVQEHRAGGRVRLVEEAPDRLVVEVEGPGGLLALRRSFHPIYRAVLEPTDGSHGARRLATYPLNLVLMGVEVPPGRHRVVVEVSAWPETLAGLVALCLALGLVWIVVSRRVPTEAELPAST